MGSMLCRKGNVLLKKDKPKKDRRLTEPVAAFIIIAALLLTMAVSALGGWEAERAAKNAAREAVQAGTQAGAFSGGRQLSDPLLVLVNGQTPLPEGWGVTPRMVDDELVDIAMYEDYAAMCKAAEKEDVWFWVASGYRSVEEQEEVLARAIEENRKAGMGKREAEEDALRTIARPGYSEHHTGLAIDLNEVSDAFEKTKAYAWLREHSADYGFIERYQAEKAAITGIDKESWHYRYVGRRHAKEMKRLGLCLEEYVVYLQKQGVR